MKFFGRPGGVLVAALLLFTATPAAEAGRYSPEGPHVTVVAAGARLNLRLARLVGESMALECVKELPRHGGMLLSVRDTGHPERFRPRYRFVHVDEVAIDAAGRVIADLFDMPLRQDPPDEDHRLAFVARARYIIDVPAGEAIDDGLIPGQRVRILARPEALEAERDHSVPAPRPCEP